MPTFDVARAGIGSSLREDLLRPEAYDAFGRGGGVELVETHISWVFLRDRDVFKVKKPVYFGFLDFRTEGERHEACEAEVRLNRRLAPDVYLDVVPIRRGGDGRLTLSGGGDAPPEDWAVHMVRLPDAARADLLLRTRRLTPVTIERLAERLAAFHSACRSDEETARFGDVASLLKNVDENFEQTRDTIGKYTDPDEARELREWQLGLLSRNAALFERRRDVGRVRDGHGDLRLEHVYIEDERITVIDCIEFSDRFRFADVCADVAFLSMDLAAHDRVDLAEQLLAVYAREANDFDLYAVVDFYESYRAFVRAKISTFVAEDPEIDEQARREAAKLARRYFVLALAAGKRPALTPSVIAVGGVIASGKSTIATALGRALGAPVVEADRTRKSILGVPATQSLDDAAWSGAYSPVVTGKVYEELFRRAQVVLASGRPVVLDASFRSRAVRAQVAQLARAFEVPMLFVECRAPEAVCRARLVEREHRRSVSDGRLSIFDEFAQKFEGVTELPARCHAVVDTQLSVEESLASLRERVPGWPPKAEF